MASDPSYPETLLLRFTKKFDLRYGENPHQSAAFYADPAAGGASIASAAQLQGKELSFNNIADADTALECVRGFARPACVIVKHANPCGVAVADDTLAAYEQAYRTDPTSAFGGIIAFNRTLDGATARAILDRQFVEVIVAPAVDAAARAALAGKPNVRVLETGRSAGRDRRRARVPQRRRRPAGAVPRQRQRDARGPARGHRRASRRRRNWTTCCSPGRSASTSSPTPSSTRASGRPSASAPAR